MTFFELGEQPHTETDIEWDEFVDNHPHGSVLQTSAWARLKSRFGWSPQRVWVKRDGRIVAGAQMLIKGYAWGLVRIGYVPHGPLVDWDDDELVKLLFNQIDTAAYKNRAALVKIEPMLWQDEFDPDRWQQICDRYGCETDTDSIQPPRTVRVDLRPSEDEIMAAMKSKTRYNIRLSGRKDVTVRQGTRDDLPAFVRMIHTTGQRNEFGVHVPKYYEVAYDQFDEFMPGHVALFLAEYEGDPLAAVMVFRTGKQAAYLYGASSNKERKRMPTYAVQWAAMQWAKENGCEWYDMWGVPDYDPETLEDQFMERSEGLWGVYRFKRGWGGNVARTVGTADRPYNKLAYWLYRRRRGLDND